MADKRKSLRLQRSTTLGSVKSVTGLKSPTNKVTKQSVSPKGRKGSVIAPGLNLLEQLQREATLKAKQDQEEEDAKSSEEEIRVFTEVE